MTPSEARVLEVRPRRFDSSNTVVLTPSTPQLQEIVAKPSITIVDDKPVSEPVDTPTFSYIDRARSMAAMAGKVATKAYTLGIAFAKWTPHAIRHGPLFHQKVVSIDGKITSFPKLQTMDPDASSRLHEMQGMEFGPRGKPKNGLKDPRLGPGGEEIRAAHFDEIPMMAKGIFSVLYTAAVKRPLHKFRQWLSDTLLSNQERTIGYRAAENEMPASLYQLVGVRGKSPSHWKEQHPEGVSRKFRSIFYGNHIGVFPLSYIIPYSVLEAKLARKKMPTTADGSPLSEDEQLAITNRRAMRMQEATEILVHRKLTEATYAEGEVPYDNFLGSAYSPKVTARALWQIVKNVASGKAGAS